MSGPLAKNPGSPRQTRACGSPSLSQRWFGGLLSPSLSLSSVHVSDILLPTFNVTVGGGGEMPLTQRAILLNLEDTF